MAANTIPTGKTKAIELRRPASIGDADAALARIRSVPSDTDLLLPNRPTGRSFAGTAALLQLIVTWSRHCPDGQLRVHVQEGDEDDRARATLESLVATDHGMLAVALAGRVTARRGARDLSRLAVPMLRERLEQANGDGEALRGTKAFAMCLDGNEFGAPRLLYRNRPSWLAREAELHELEQFKNLSQTLADRLARGSAGGHLASVASFSRILYELFRNTHEWARTDAGGQPYPPERSVRGIRVERHAVDRDTERQLTEAQPPLRDFCAHPQLRPRDGRRRFAELTVFDSGPGVAARQLDREGGQTHIEAEHQALRACLRKHISSSRKESKGNGLHQVLEDLSALSAFLWLRTGRLSLYRDFAATPYRPAIDDDEPFLLDWKGGIGGVTEAPKAAGSFFTALLPIGDDPNQTTL